MHPSSAVVLFAACVAAPALAVDVPSAPAAPRYELVESRGKAAPSAALTIARAGGQPAVVYVDVSGLDDETVGTAPLIHRWYDGWAWRDETLGTLAMTGSASELSLLQFDTDAQGGRHVLALEPAGPDPDDDRLVYLRRDTNGDLRETLASGVVTVPVFALSTTGQPYAAWLRDPGMSGGTLVLRRREAAGVWTDVPLPAPPGSVLRARLAATADAVHVVWAEAGQSEVHLRHMRIAASGTSVRPVQTWAGVRVEELHFAAAGDGRVETLAIREATPGDYVIERRTLAAGATAWGCPGGECAFALPGNLQPYTRGNALAVASDGRRALVFGDGQLQQAQLALVDPTLGAGWHYTALTPGSAVGDVAFDGSGTAVALLHDRSDHGDLLLVRQQAPWTRQRLPAATSVALGAVANAVSVAFAGDGSTFVYARAGAADDSGAVWSLQGADFAADALPPGYLVDAADLGIARDGSFHVAFRDARTQQVFHARRTALPGSRWQVTRVSQGDGVPATDPLLVFGPNNRPRVIYRQAGVLAVAAQRSSGVWLSREIATAADGARPRAASVDEAQLIYVSWYDMPAQELRLTVVSGDVGDPAQPLGVVLDTVPRPAGWILGQSAHDVVATGDGGVAIAYSQSAQGAHGLGYSVFDRYLWSSSGSEPQPFGPHPVSHVVVDAQLGAAGAPIVAWVQGATTATQTLHVAHKRLGDLDWTREALGGYDVPRTFLALSGAHGIRLAFVEDSALYLARRHVAMDADAAPSLLMLLPARSHLASYCVCFYLSQIGNPDNVTLCDLQPADPTRLRGSDSDDAGLMERVRTRFATTPAGRYYLTLFAEHSEEIVRLTLADPLRLEQRARVLGDLVPALRTFADGDGSGYRLTTATLADARAIWQQWAATGSPALRAAVDRELARTGNLQHFDGLTLEQWFVALTVGTATDRIHVDGFD